MYYEQEPWGEERADQRQEAFRQRLLSAIFGPGDDPVPKASFPYFEKQMSAEEQLVLTRQMESRLVWDGTKHVWAD